MHTERPLLQRLLDRAEDLIWTKQDTRMRAAGWEVVHLGRWHRQYRHPLLLARALPAARSRAEREAQQLVARRAAHRLPSQQRRQHHGLPTRSGSARSAVPARSSVLLPGEVTAWPGYATKGPAA